MKITILREGRYIEIENLRGPILSGHEAYELYTKLRAALPGLVGPISEDVSAVDEDERIRALTDPT